MRRFLVILLMLMITLTLLIFLYACLFRPDIVGDIFHKKMTSPPAIFTAMIFVVGIGGIIWKKLKLAINSKGQ